MFRVYDKKANRFLIGQELESILILRAIDLHETGGKFVFLPNTPILNVDIDKKTSKTRKMLAKLEPNWILIKSIDCGDEAAEWLNTCLRKSSLRLIRAEYEITDKSILNRNDVLIFVSDSR
ncbi:PREDICTED: uncharacterized protein LOC105571096 [Vollenhovia emeryi]|uniref:uncharacterized protein LOC105571096 n=1 Tax=Vollenhovia emeryi TaxID=411798 RepID=UPI0005F384AF|nr:PREDICTED: uncharacterized protein LOC105571096 [Vollenhovia emeryi]